MKLGRARAAGGSGGGRVIVWGILQVVLAVFLFGVDGAGAEERRSIVFMLVDDMRWDSMSLAGREFPETPNLDALARGGVLFENAFVTTSLCSPSRATILTGVYAHRHGVRDNSTPFDPDLPTFPAALQAAGYRTAFIGKWHMGGASDDPQPGFDRWVSFRGQGVYADPTFNVDGQRTAREGYVTDLITDYALEFLDSVTEGPFFLYVSHKAVHANFEPAPRHKGRYAGRRFVHPASMANTEENYRGKPDWVRRQRGSWHGVDGMYDGAVDFDRFAIDYAETMLAVDESAGRIVEKLRETGRLDSTLLVFTSDNGFLFGEHGLIDKRTMYEPSIRVPLIVHCPQTLAGGARRSEMVLNVDLAPTFLEAAGVEAPATMQGRSFWPLLRGEAGEWRKEFLYEYFWERSFPQTPTVIGVRGERYKYMKFHGVWDRLELYDLERDPDEMNNLLGGIEVGSEAGSVEFQIRRRGDRSLVEIWEGMEGALGRLSAELGVEAEPAWGAGR